MSDLGPVTKYCTEYWYSPSGNLVTPTQVTLTFPHHTLSLTLHLFHEGCLGITNTIKHFGMQVDIFSPPVRSRTPYINSKFHFKSIPRKQQTSQDVSQNVDDFIRLPIGLGRRSHRDTT